MPAIKFEVDEGLASWSFGDETFESGVPHEVDANAELAEAVGAAASAGVLHLASSKTLAKDSVESDKDSLKLQESLSEEQQLENRAVAKLTAEHDFNCNQAEAAFVAGDISEEQLDMLQTESGQLLTDAIAKVAEDDYLRDLLAVNEGRGLTPAIDEARRLMGRSAMQKALGKEDG